MLASAFAFAKKQNSGLCKDWVDASGFIEKVAPGGFARLSVQQCGDIDILLRCIEDEAKVSGSIQQLEILGSVSYQISLSSTWVASMYEIFRNVKKRNVTGDGFNELFHQLTLLRIPLFKNEAQDRKLPDGKAHLVDNLEGAQMEGAEQTIYEYDNKDPNRSFAPLNMLSGAGSVEWIVPDIKNNCNVRLERRDLSQRVLHFFRVGGEWEDEITGKTS